MKPGKLSEIAFMITSPLSNTLSAAVQIMKVNDQCQHNNVVYEDFVIVIVALSLLLNTFETYIGTYVFDYPNQIVRR